MLPPGWEYRLRPDTGMYQFFMTQHPSVKFELSDTALQLYADSPEKLAMLMRRNVDQYQLAEYARSVAEHKKVSPPVGDRDYFVGQCTTPYYCHWRRKHGGYTGACDMCDLNVDPLPYVKKTETLKQ